VVPCHPAMLSTAQTMGDVTRGGVCAVIDAARRSGRGFWHCAHPAAACARW
jgi:hypothetical protein